MLHPPLYLRLTSYATNREEYVLLSKIHGFERDEGDVATKIKTFVESALIVAFICKERPEEILRKAYQVTLNYHKLQIQAAHESQAKSEWDDEDNDDNVTIWA